jgi:hypothetical protein
MSYHASANTYEINGAASLHRRIEAEEAARELALVESNTLADLIGYESPAWETFWRTVPEPSTNVTILAMLQAEIKRINDAGVIADHEDDLRLYADLRRGG